MATNINIDTSQFKDKVQQIRAGIPELLKPRFLAPELISRMQQRFITKTAPDGQKWAKRKESNREAGSLLLRSGNIETGHLVNAIGLIAGRPTGYASNTGLGFRIGLLSKPYVDYSRYTPREVNPIKYGRYHQMGEGGQTKRRFIGMSEADRQWALARMRAHCATLVK